MSLLKLDISKPFYSYRITSDSSIKIRLIELDKIRPQVFRKISEFDINIYQKITELRFNYNGNEIIIELSPTANFKELKKIFSKNQDDIEVLTVIRNILMDILRFPLRLLDNNETLSTKQKELINNVAKKVYTDYLVYDEIDQFSGGKSSRSKNKRTYARNTKLASPKNNLLVPKRKKLPSPKRSNLYVPKRKKLPSPK